MDQHNAPRTRHHRRDLNFIPANKVRIAGDDGSWRDGDRELRLFGGVCVAVESREAKI